MNSSRSARRLVLAKANTSSVSMKVSQASYEPFEGIVPSPQNGLSRERAGKSCRHCATGLLTSLVGCLDHLSVGRWVVCLNVGVNSFLHHHLVKLCLSQQAPHSWLVAALRELISTVQVTNMYNKNLKRER